MRRLIDLDTNLASYNTTHMKTTNLISAWNKTAVIEAFSDYLKHVLHISFTFFSLSTLNSQQTDANQIKKIDSLIKVAHKYYMEDKEKESYLISQKQIIPLSNTINYSKGLCYGNYYVASAQYFTGRYRQSIHYIKRAQSYNAYLQRDPRQSARNYWLFGHNLAALKLYTLASKNYHQSINILKTIKNRSETDLLTQSAVYISLSDLYTTMDVKDSIYYYLQLQNEALEKIPSQLSYIQMGDHYLGMGNYFLTSKKVDSATYYFQKSLSTLKNRHHTEINSLIGLAETYSFKGMYDEAIKYYTTALEKSKKYNYDQLSGHIYARLKDCYFNKNDIEKSKKYADLQADFDQRTSSNIENNKSNIIREIINEENAVEEAEYKKHSFKIRVVFFLIAVASSAIVFFIIRKNEKKKNRRLAEKKQLIIEKIEYASELEQKLKISLEEVLEHAKNNNPVFFEKFQILYPDFRYKLLEINGNLTSGELILLAYVYLNLSSKEIADYTFRSYRTVQTRKYTLRKKLGLETNQDLYIWLKTIC